MASQHRQERQLMRQRGAGRDVAPADFGFNFGFGGSRTDRQQMRQRGAANRKVDNVDFGFSFTPARSRRSNSRTSNASNSNSTARRTSKTPAQPSREASAQPSVRSISHISDDARMSRGSREVSAQPELHSLKRRRTGGTGPSESPETRRKTSSSRRKPSTIFPIAEDAEEQEQVPDVLQHVSLDQGMDVSEAELDTRLDDNEKENAAPNLTKPTRKRKKRKSIGQQAMRKKKRSSGDAITHHATIATTKTQESTRDTPSPAQRSFVVTIPPVEPSLDESRVDTSTAPLQPAPKKRKKRKSVVLVKKKRRSSNGMNRAAKRQSPPPGTVLDDNNQSGADEIPESTAGDVPSRRPSPVSRSSPVIQSIEVDYADDGDYIDEEQSPEPPTHAPARKARKIAASSSSSTIRQTKGSASQHSKSSFPVLTHRLVNLEALPTIAGVNARQQSNDSDGEERMPAPADRSGPRAVDVLAQICRETVETAMERLDSQSQDKPRAQRQRKRNALEAFGADLDSRLFDMSIAVEDRVSLEARVRKTKREKADLQARWIEVRRERERIALKCDRLRREHWESEHSREQRWKLSEAARKAELELSKDASDEEKKKKKEGLEFLLRSVADEVTNAHGGGLLQRMQAFNSQLEKVAEVLEGKD